MSLRKRRTRRLGARVVAGMLALTVWGLGTGTSGAQATDTRGVTDTTIRVGGLLTAANYAGAEVGAKVIFDKVNAAGGVNGRKYQYVDTLNDNNNNDANTEAARKLAAEDVFAAVPVISNFFAGAKIFQDADIPYFGWGFHEAYCKQKEGFSFNGCGVAKVANSANPVWPGLIKKNFPKAKTVGFLVEDTDAARGGTEAYQRALKSLGLTESFAEFGIPVTNADYTPYIQKAVAANPDVVFIVSSTVAALTMAGGLKRAGYTGILTSPAIYDARIAASPTAAQALENVYAYISFAPFESDNPAIKQMLADVKQYAPAGTLVTQPLASGYFSAMLLNQMLEKVGKDLSYKTFYKAAKGFTFDGDGALGKITFPDAQNHIPLCGSLVVLKGNAFEQAVPLSCFEEPKTKAKKG